MIENIKYKVLGVMSGTSLDGVDLAICTFSKTNEWVFEIVKSKTVKYSCHWKNKLAELHLKNGKEIKKTDKDYGEFLGEIISSFLSTEKVDFIAVHGHTIFHEPENKYTLQIGCGKTISKRAKTTTINDFRSLDVSLNGQGAPLVPIGDLKLFSDFKYCINIGGFANISIKEGKNRIKAFDICPANIVMNKISQKLGVEFDEGGAGAESGKLIPGLLIKLNNLDFYKKDSAKSLGREWVEKFINPLLLEEYKSEDILRTFCEHIAMQIGVFLKDKSALFTGGGAFNTFLMSRIQHYSTSKIITPSKEIINFKEALIFAFLAVLRVRNEVNCLKSATGAKHDNCGGIIYKY